MRDALDKKLDKDLEKLGAKGVSRAWWNKTTDKFEKEGSI